MDFIPKKLKIDNNRFTTVFVTEDKDSLVQKINDQLYLDENQYKINKYYRGYMVSIPNSNFKDFTGIVKKAMPVTDIHTCFKLTFTVKLQDKITFEPIFKWLINGLPSHITIGKVYPTQFKYGFFVYCNLYIKVLMAYSKEMEVNKIIKIINDLDSPWGRISNITELKPRPNEEGEDIESNFNYAGRDFPSDTIFQEVDLQESDLVYKEIDWESPMQEIVKEIKIVESTIEKEFIANDIIVKNVCSTFSNKSQEDIYYCLIDIVECIIHTIHPDNFDMKLLRDIPTSEVKKLFDYCYNDINQQNIYILSVDIIVNLIDIINEIKQYGEASFVDITNVVNRSMDVMLIDYGKYITEIDDSLPVINYKYISDLVDQVESFVHYINDIIESFDEIDPIDIIESDEEYVSENESEIYSDEDTF